MYESLEYNTGKKLATISKVKDITLLPSNKKTSHILRKVSVGMLSTNMVRNQLKLKSDKSTSSRSMWEASWGSFSAIRSFKTLCNIVMNNNNSLIEITFLAMMIQLLSGDAEYFASYNRESITAFHTYVSKSPGLSNLLNNYKWYIFFLDHICLKFMAM